MADAPTDSVPRVTAGPGGRVRFAVFGADARRSMAWTVWTARNTPDVYVAARPLGGYWKMSLHASGHWHSGLAEGLAVAFTGGTPKNDRWLQPAEFAPGVRRGVQLVFPDVELRHWPPGATDDKPVIPIPAAGDGYATCVELIFMAPGPALRLEIDDAFNVAAIDLNDKTRLWVVARRLPWTAEDVEWLLVAKRAMLARVDPAVLRTALNPRSLLIGKLADDLRFAVDYAVDLAPAG
jgi:hypothetical protein